MTDTLPRVILQLAEKRKDAAALRYKDTGTYKDISWKEAGEQISLYCRALLALGLEKGDRVAIMAPNSPVWVYADLGAMAMGGISVPVYHTEGIDSVLHILNDSEACTLFLYSEVIADELRERLEDAPSLQNIILLESDEAEAPFMGLSQFLAGAESVTQDRSESLLAEDDASETATLVYTSGTTGPPKGAVLTHGNFLSNIRACRELFDISDQDTCLSFLPLSHVFERMAGYYLMMYEGAVIAYAENFDSVPANLVEVKPTIAISVPRLYEKMYARIMERVLDGPWLKKQLFFSGLKVCKALVRRELEGEAPSAPLAALAGIYRKHVFSKLREPLGGRIRFFVSGGAPLTPDIAEFFLAAGIPIYEGYGLTETSPVLAVNTPDTQRLGTVGKPLPGCEVKIAEDGEILARGPNIFQGYWNSPEATEEIFTEEGWLKTGDLGEIDRDGFLKITGRKKDLIVTAGGENVAPQNLENLYKTDKFLSNALVYGDRKPFLTALLVPNFDNLENYARHKNFEYLNHCDLVSHPRVLDLIRRRVDKLQADLPSHHHIKRFTLLSRDFSKEDGEVTPTMKVKRMVVQEHFHQILEEMYTAKDHGIHDQAFCVVEPTSETQGAKRDG
ncbi:MAG: long-chain fatty acid--CoA ligase [Desulfuromonadales bacterium]